jgi:hypothetical protein
MNQKGQGLVEALVALGAAVVIISAITVAVVTAVNNADFAKYQNLATDFAKQGMETIKQQSQLNWNDIATYSGTGANPWWCLPQGTTDLYPHDAASCLSVNVMNKFARDVTFTKVPPNPNCPTDSPCCIKGAAIIDCANPESNLLLCPTQVSVAVKWTDGKCSTDPNSVDYFCHSVKLDSCLQDIYRTQ